MEIADDLVEEIVKRLPLECLFRFRLVCRGWNRLLRHLWADAASKQPDLLISLPNAKHGCLVYSFLSRKWRPLSFSSFPLPEFSITGCGSGLLLLEAPSMAAPHVCNPHTGSSFPLPKLAVPLNVVAGWIEQGQNTGSFKVLLLGKKCREGGTIEVQGYDSVSNLWTKMGEYDLGVNSKRVETAYCDGFVFLMGADNVAVFDINNGEWNRVEMPADAAMRNNLWPRLVSCGDFLVLVRLIRRAHVLEEVIMWEMCGGNSRWKEKGRMPEWVRGRLKRRWIECVGVGENVCFRSHGSAEIVVYSLREGSWQWLPMCPAAFLSDSRARSLAFQRLYNFPSLQPSLPPLC